MAFTYGSSKTKNLDPGGSIGGPGESVDFGEGLMNLAGFFLQPLQHFLGAFDPQSYGRDADPISVENMDRIVQGMRKSGWSDEDIDWVMRNGSNIGAPLEYVQALVEDMTQFREAREINDRARQAFADYLQTGRDTVAQGQVRIGEARTRTEEDIGRFDAILNETGDTPGALRSDLEYGHALGEAENYINAAANRTRREAGAATSQSGLAGSGAAASAIMRAEEAAGVAKAGSAGSLLRRASGERDEYQKYLDDLGAQETTLNQYLVDIERGRMPAELALGEFLLDAYPQLDPMNDVLGTKLGQDQYRLGQVSQNYGTVFDVFGFATDKAFDFGETAVNVLRPG